MTPSDTLRKQQKNPTKNNLTYSYIMDKIKSTLEDMETTWTILGITEYSNWLQFRLFVHFWHDSYN